MNTKEISLLLGLFFFTVFVIIQLNYSKTIASSNCEEVYINQYSCIVIRKEKEVMNHSQLKLYCIKTSGDSTFIIYPDVMIPYDSLYYRTEIGDTLLKQLNTNYFLILNTNKRDSFVFGCKGD